MERMWTRGYWNQRRDAGLRRTRCDSASGTTPFLRAAKTADLAAMQLLLDHGANSLLVTKEGTTALMAAAGLGWNYGYSQVPETQAIKAIQLCLDKGVDINAANAKGETALHGAAMRGATGIIQLLADRGARLDAKDKAASPAQNRGGR